MPSSGNLSDPGIKPVCLTSLALVGRFFTTSATWEVHKCMYLGANTFCWVPICISNFRYLKSLGISPLAGSFSYSQASHIAPRGGSRHEYWSPLGVSSSFSM